MNKKMISVAVAVLFGAALTIGLQARAENNNSTDNNRPITAVKNMNMLSARIASLEALDNDDNLPSIDNESKNRTSLVISPKGKVSMYGATVVSDAMPACITTSCPTHILQLKIWGHAFTVNLMSETKMKPEATTFATGDIVSLQGSIDASTGIITARQIRNLTKADDKSGEISARLKDLIEQVKKFCAAIPEATRPAICKTL